MKKQYHGARDLILRVIRLELKLHEVNCHNKDDPNVGQVRKTIERELRKTMEHLVLSTVWVGKQGN